MSLFDAIKGELMKSAASAVTDQLLGGSAKPKAAPAAPAAAGSGDLTSMLTEQVFGMVKEKGVGSIVDQFTKSGMGDAAASWVSTGANKPVSEEQVAKALPTDTIGGLASKLGVDNKMVIAAVTALLPIIIDKMTPHGKVDDTHS